MDPNDPLVEVHPSVYKAASALLTQAEVDQDVETTIDRLLDEGHIVHMFNRDLPPHLRVGGYDRKNGYYSRGASAWLTRSREAARNGWWVFDPDGELSPSSPYTTKRAAMQGNGIDSATRVDTGLYESDGYTFANTETAMERGLL